MGGRGPGGGSQEGGEEGRGGPADSPAPPGLWHPAPPEHTPQGRHRLSLACGQPRPESTCGHQGLLMRLVLPVVVVDGALASTIVPGVDRIRHGPSPEARGLGPQFPANLKPTEKILSLNQDVVSHCWEVF